MSGEGYPQGVADGPHRGRAQRPEQGRKLVAIKLNKVVADYEPDEGIAGSERHNGRHGGVLRRRRDSGGDHRVEVAVTGVVTDDNPWFRSVAEVDPVHLTAQRWAHSRARRSVRRT